MISSRVCGNWAFIHLVTYPPPFGAGNDIPIVQKLTHAYTLWHAVLQHFPRLSRFTLGAKIDALYCDTLELALLAGYTKREHKTALVDRALSKFDALKFFLQVAWEVRALDTKKYARLTEPLVEVGKMLGGWRKQLDKTNPPH